MTTVWFDGKLMPLSEARVSVLAHTLHYGVGVFEGIRSYATDDGAASIFRLEDHVRRLDESARICGLELPCTRQDLIDACIAVLEANELRDAYLRPILFQDDGTLGGLGSSPPVRAAVACQAWGAYLGEEGLRHGIRVRVSAFRRAGHGGFMSRAKINGQYVTSTLAKREALSLGYDEALLMDNMGRVAEGSGENLFMIRNGVLITPPESAPILPGITRATVLHLARQMADEIGLESIREDHVPRDGLMVADEVFLTGTAAELTPVREVDDRTIGEGSAGPITRRLQAAYFDLVRGRGQAPARWRTTFGSLVP